MLVCENELSMLEVQQFKDYWNNNQNRTFVNWRLGDEVLDRRLLIDKQSPEWAIIERIVNKYIKHPTEIWSALQRQQFAHQIHIDDYGKDLPGYRYTFVFSLDTEPRFKTYVWEEKFWNNESFSKFVAEWGEQRHKMIPTSNISEYEDLEHTLDENQNAYLCDYLKLEGVYEYKAGDGVFFYADQLHCTSNWKKYDIPHRDLLQIHVVTNHYVKI